MIGYFDPESLKIGETEGVITFVNAADGGDVQEIRIENRKDAKRIIAALKDQMEHGIAGLNGRFRKVQGTFARLPDSHQEGIITDANGRKETPVRIGFELKPGELPGRGICIAIGEMVEGALMVERMTVAPIAPMPVPQQGMQTPA
jgi:hypothetical protein